MDQVGVAAAREGLSGTVRTLGSSPQAAAAAEHVADLADWAVRITPPSFDDGFPRVP